MLVSTILTSGFESPDTTVGQVEAMQRFAYMDSRGIELRIDELLRAGYLQSADDGGVEIAGGGRSPTDLSSAGTR